MAIQGGTFCGNCGAPLAPGAPFCGRCGTPARVAAPMQGPPPAAYAAYPGYAYPRAQPAPGRIARDHTTQIVVAVGLIALLLLATVIVSIIAINNNSGTHSVCTQNCGPKFVTPLPEAASFKSSQYGFVVAYYSNWKVQQKTAAGVELSTDAGAVSVVGQQANQPLDQVINAFVAALPSATYQSVSQVLDVKGAHLGDTNGLGAIYSANFIGSNSSAIKVRFAVIAASKNGVTVVMFAIDPSDTKDFASGIPEAQAFDYMCTTFQWAST
jgi:zinc-ribbon domain